jgi:hypothetical protein
MPLDVSLEAIEAELAIASRGGQVADLAVRRAQVLATLLAAEEEPPAEDGDMDADFFAEARKARRKK